MPPLAGDGVGSAEADAADLGGQAVGMAGHHRHCVRTVRFDDAMGQRLSDSVAPQLGVHLAVGSVALSQWATISSIRRWPMPSTSVRRSGSSLDDPQGVQPELGDHAAGELLAQAAHRVAGQVALEATQGPRVFQQGALDPELSAVGGVVLPAAVQLDELALGDVADVADDDHLTHALVWAAGGRQPSRRRRP